MGSRGQLELLQIRPTPQRGPKTETTQVDPAVRAEHAKERARRLAESRPAKLRLAYARAFCGEVLTRYWQKLKPKFHQTIREAPDTGSVPLRSDGVAAALELSDVAASLPIDDASYLVGRTYAAMLPEDFRSTNGVFYTPPAIVERLLDSVTASGINWAQCRALDPACGGGAFLGPVARRMVASLKGSDKKIALRNLSSRLKGYEIDPFAAWLSAVFLDATLNEELGFTGDSSFNAIEICDSLTRSTETAEFDLVIGNPPYGRVGLSEDLRSTYQRSLYGHANLYGVFLDLALRKVKEGGVIAYVTPTGFLSGHYFKNLRSLLAEKAPPIGLDFISQREGVFDDVIQETILAVFRRGAASHSPNINFVEVSSRNKLTISTAEKIPLPATLDQPWIVPRTSNETGFVKRLHEMTSRLANWGYAVSTGPLVWNRFKKQLRDEEEPGAVPLIWAESVSADGEFAFRAARRNHAPYFAVTKGDDALLVEKWSKKNLSPEALARIELVRAGAGAEHVGMMVEFPNHGGSRPLDAGPSSMISKHVIEVFAPRFLHKPMVLWLSQSGRKVVARDEILAKKIGIDIDQTKLLPDIILVDMLPNGVFIVFVEVVATDGPISEDRRKQLAALASRYGEDRLAFVTAFADRDSAEFRKAFGSIAWNSFAWLVSEPEKIVALFKSEAGGAKLHKLVGLTQKLQTSVSPSPADTNGNSD